MDTMKADHIHACKTTLNDDTPLECETFDKTSGFGAKVRINQAPIPNTKDTRRQHHPPCCALVCHVAKSPASCWLGQVTTLSINGKYARMVPCYERTSARFFAQISLPMPLARRHRGSRVRSHQRPIHEWHLCFCHHYFHSMSRTRN